MAQQIIDIGAAANDGTGEPLRDAFNAVNENFTEIYAAGPVGSNVVISGNTITVTGTNNNLVLAATGIGNIQANSTIMPSIDAVYDMGAPTRRIDTVYATYFVGNGSLLTGIAGGSGNGTAIANGTSNVAVVSSGGNVTIGVGGTGNVAVFSSTIANIKGNLIGGNITTAGLISAAGNVTGGNLLATGNIYIGNTVFTRTLTVGTRTTPVTVPLASNNSFNVLSRTGNVLIYTT